MNKKEISELRRLFTPDRCTITRICGCYVDSEKQKRALMKEAFLSLPEEEMYKYFDMFKKTLSGTIGKQLQTISFPLEQEKEGGAQEFLLRLKKSQLKEDDLLNAFYDKVIESFLYPENYYIVLIHCTYDIPGRASDGTEMFDASDHVYEYLLCSICPVNLTKPGLCYDEASQTITERIRDWFVEAPVTGFLFPAFTDRDTDIHAALYYSKNPDERKGEFAEAMFGSSLPLSASSQKDSFQALITDALEEECTFEAVRNIQTSLNEMMEEHKDDPEPPVLNTVDVKQILYDSGARQEKLQNVEVMDLDLSSGEDGQPQEIYLSNLVNTRKMEIRTPDVVITVKPERAELVETRIIDGRPYFLIPADDSVEVNGIPVSAVRHKDESR